MLEGPDEARPRAAALLPGVPVTTKVITTCDGCGREIESRFRWMLTGPPGGTNPLHESHFHDLLCLSEAVLRELGRPKVVPIFKPGGINHSQEPFQHEEPKT